MTTVARGPATTTAVATGTAPGAMTTEPRRRRRYRRPRAPGRGSGLSVRTRMTAAVALLTSLALAGAGVVVFALESARINRATATSVDREIAEFRQFQVAGVDPATGRGYNRADDLIEGFLSQN